MNNTIGMSLSERCVRLFKFTFWNIRGVSECLKSAGISKGLLLGVLSLVLQVSAANTLYAQQVMAAPQEISVTLYNGYLGGGSPTGGARISTIGGAPVYAYLVDSSSRQIVDKKPLVDGKASFLDLEPVKPFWAIVSMSDRAVGNVLTNISDLQLDMPAAWHASHPVDLRGGTFLGAERSVSEAEGIDLFLGVQRPPVASAKTTTNAINPGRNGWISVASDSFQGYDYILADEGAQHPVRRYGITGWTNADRVEIGGTVYTSAPTLSDPIWINAAPNGDFNSVVRFDPSNDGNATISYIVEDVADAISGNAAAITIPVIAAQADLAITSSGTATASAGGTFSYSFTVSNNGPSFAENIYLNVASVVNNPLYSNVVFKIDGTTASLITPANTISRPGAEKGLPSGGSIVLTIEGNLAADADGTVTTGNISVASTQTSDPVSGNNTAYSSAIVYKNADLSLTKTLNTDPVVAGGAIQYTLHIANAGPSVARNVEVTDNVPSIIQSPQYSINNGTSWLPWTGSYTIPEMSVGGAGVQILLRGTVSQTATGKVINTASVNSDDSDDSDPDDDEDTSTSDDVEIHADVQLIMTGPNTVSAGESITYTVTISNNGPSVAKSVTLTNALPVPLTNGTYNADGGSTQSWTSGTSISIPEIPVNGSYVITFNGDVPASATDGSAILNQGEITSTVTTFMPESTTTASKSSTVSRSASVSISKTGPASAIAGQDITYTLTAANGGPADASNVTIIDLINTNYFADARYSTDGGTVWQTWNGSYTAGTIVSGGSRTILLRMRVLPDVVGSVTNTASVTSPDDDDPELGGGSATTNVTSQADLGIEVVAGTSGAHVGDQVSFVYTVTNAGPSSASGIVVNNIIPNGYTYSSNNGGATFAGAQLTWNVGNINPGESRNITVVLTVKEATAVQYLNVASVTSAVNDPNSQNDSDSDAVALINQFEAQNDTVGPVTPTDVNVPIVNLTDNDEKNDRPVLPGEFFLKVGGVQVSSTGYTVSNNAGTPGLLLRPDGTLEVLPTAKGGTYTFTYEICDIHTPTICGSAQVSIHVETSTAAVSGSVFHDENMDGIRNNGEAGLAGWVIYADLNNNGRFDTGEPSTNSSAAGEWTIADVPFGQVYIREVIPAQSRWIQSYPDEASGFAHHITINGTDGVSGLTFGNYYATQSSGYVFRDLNKNGKRDANEPPLKGWTIYVDLNENGKLDPGEPSSTSNDHGMYDFPNIEPGTYTIRAVLPDPDSWELSVPSAQTNFGHSIVIGSASNHESLDFGGYEQAHITGLVWLDRNGDAKIDTDENRLEGWGVYLDLNGNGEHDADEPETHSDSNGIYQFKNVAPGTYLVAEMIPDRWLQTYPRGDRFTHSVTVIPGYGLQQTFDFGNAEAVTIEGFVWHDINTNGVYETTERLQGGWSLYVDGNRNGIRDAAELVFQTGSDGRYVLEHMLPGTYHIHQIKGDDWIQTFPEHTPHHAVTVLSGEVRSVTFGNAHIDDFNNGTPFFADVSGNVWYEYEEDGVWKHQPQAGAGGQIIDEIPLRGWEVTLTGKAIGGELIQQTQFTNADGSYTFRNVPAGEYDVRRTFKPDWMPAFPLIAEDDPHGEPHRVRIDANFAGIAAAERKIVAGNHANWTSGIRSGNGALFAGAYLFFDMDGDGAADHRVFVSGSFQMEWTDERNRMIDFTIPQFRLIGESKQLGLIEIMNSSMGQFPKGIINGQSGDSLAVSTLNMPFDVAVDGVRWIHSNQQVPGLTGYVSQLLPYNQKFTLVGSPVVFTDEMRRRMATLVSMEFLPLYGADFGVNQSVFGTADANIHRIGIEENGARHILHHNTRLRMPMLGTGIRENQMIVRHASNRDLDFLEESSGASGIRFVSALSAGETAQVQVTTSSTGYLHAWFDFNRDGIWSEDEKVFNGIELDFGTRILDFNVHNGKTGGEIWARFRYCDCPDISDAYSVINSGEIEDYKVHIQSFGASVSGKVWLDVNSDGMWNDGERGLSGIRVFADLNENGKLDEDEPFSLTNIQGNYILTGLYEGSLRILPASEENWLITNLGFPKYVKVSLKNDEEVTGVDFGLFRLSTSISEGSDLPMEYGLDQNYPNPFNPVTHIRYQLPEASRVSLSVLDVNGRVVATLIPGELQHAGEHTVAFDAGKLASGVYLYRLQAGKHVFTRKLTLLK